VCPTSTPEKLSVAGETETLVPVPDKATVWGLPVALSVIVSAPVREPAAVGLNVTLMLQTPLAEMEVPQVLVSRKSPVAAIPENVSVAVPVLETVTD
jgi:hypothetical protein